MTTYYVDGVDGNDANAGTSEGSGNAWATIQKAADTVVAGDNVYVKGNGTYAESVTLATAGTAALPIAWAGYTTTPDDEGIATIDPAAGDCVTGSTIHWQFWSNFRFTGGTVGYDDQFADDLMFYNCEFDNNSGDGFNGDNDAKFVRCSFHNNGGFGIDGDTHVSAMLSVFYSNTSGAMRTDGGAFIQNLIYGLTTGDNGIALLVAASSDNIVMNNTIDGENAATTTGINIVTTGNDAVVINNIIYDCNTGIVYDNDRLGFVKTNLLNSNNTDESGIVRHGYAAGNVTGAPAFTDEANDDYTLGSSSPAIDAALQPRTT